MFYIIYTLTLMLVNKRKIETSTNTVYLDLYNDAEDHHVFKDGLRIGFLLRSDKYQPYITFSVFQNRVVNNSQTEFTYLEYEVWTAQNFTNLNESYPGNLSFYCLTHPEDVILRGNAISDNSATFFIMYDWKNCSNWPTSDEILNDPGSLVFYMYVYTPYVDYKDIDHPIKFSLDSRYFSYWSYSSYAFYNVLIQK